MLQFNFRFRFWPRYCQHQPTNFHSNRGFMASCGFLNLAATASRISFRFRYGDALHLKSFKTISIPNFDKISQPAAETLPLSVLKTNGHHIEMLFPVSILRFSSSSALIMHRPTKFYPNWTIAVRGMTFLSIFQYGDHTATNLLPVSSLATSHILEDQNYPQTKFRQYISIHG